ncbi:cation diffusion facilitator family transporter [Tunturiibacter empetritectus]
MSTTAQPEQAATPHSAKRSAALFSVLAAFAVTLLKLLTGLLTGSLGMLSEAAHSGIDLIAAAITLFSVQVSDRPADADHTYGHGKIESLSAAIESVLMLGSCVWILTEAVRRIAHRQHLALNFSIWPFLVLLLSITVDYTRSGKLQKSQTKQKVKPSKPTPSTSAPTSGPPSPSSSASPPATSASASRSLNSN